MLFLGSIGLNFIDLQADNNWIAIFYKSEGLQKVEACLTDELDSIYYVSKESDSPGAENCPTHLRVARNGEYVAEIKIDSVQSIDVRNNVPTLYITTDSLVEEIPDKENYLTAGLRYVPTDGISDPMEAIVNIRGRGNTTWFMPKKPYRLKFDKKQSLGGMTKAKSYVLIANYLDNTLMKNAVAFKIASLCGMPYVNTPVPVDLVFNGEKRGSYLLTQKIGINSGSADFDEYTGMLWEIDSYFDEEYRFRSSRFNLPCMAKDPDFLEIADEDPVTAAALWAYWKADLDLALAKIYDGKWREVLDVNQLAKYILVNHLVGNFEITQAKSIYLYKTAPGEKYCFGPVWDFDWALGFTEHSYPVGCPFVIKNTAAYDLWMKILPDQAFKDAFKEELDNFVNGGLDSLLQYIDSYADSIRISAVMDAELWPEEKFYGFERREINTSRFDENVQLLKKYITDRLSRINNSSTYLLY